LPHSIRARSVWPSLKGLFLSLMLAAVTLPRAEAAGRELVFLNWPEYVSPQVLEDFERSTGIHVQLMTFEDDAERDKLLMAGNVSNYDLVCVNHSTVGAYVASGWLAPVTVREVPNLRAIDPKWFDRVPESQGFALPYFWGSTGFAYRRDLLNQELDSWTQLLDPPEGLRGKISMTKNPRDLVSAALKALHFSINTTAESELAQAEALLMKQRPFVKTYAYDLAATRNRAALAKGEILASMAFNGDAVQVQDVAPGVQFVLPKEGAGLWLDMLAVLSQSLHKAEAYALLEYLNRPEVAARNAEYVRFATPNFEARKRLPAEFLNNKAINPSPAEVERSEFERELPPRVQRRINEIAARVTR